MTSNETKDKRKCKQNGRPKQSHQTPKREQKETIKQKLNQRKTKTC